MPLTVGLDGGYVHSAAQTSRTNGWFEVIAGTSMPTDGEAKCFAVVQKIETKPRRRLFEVLRAQAMAANQSITLLTDGGEDIPHLPLYLYPHAEHYLDWFHITMRLTAMMNTTKSLPPVTHRWTGAGGRLRRSGSGRPGLRAAHVAAVAGCR